jgi:hypothetical protein
MPAAVSCNNLPDIMVKVYWLISSISMYLSTVAYHQCILNVLFPSNAFFSYAWTREKLGAGHVLTILKSPHLQWPLNHLEVVLVKDISQLLVVLI